MSPSTRSTLIWDLCVRPGLEEGIEEIQKAIQDGRVKDYRDRVFSNYEHMLGPAGELIVSEPSVQLFAVLEPGDVGSSIGLRPAVSGAD